MKLWMARDGGETGSYLIDRVRFARHEIDGCWQGDDEIVVCPRIWHRLGGPRLKPGAGPVRIEVDPKLFKKAVTIVKASRR